WLALAELNVHDRSHERKDKETLRQHWGDWSRCQTLAPHLRHSAVIAHLARNPADFRRAIALVRQDLRSLWLAAFQSHLWNQILAAAFMRAGPQTGLMTQLIGQHALPFPKAGDTAPHGLLSDLRLPLPSARLHLDEGPLKHLYEQVLA